MSKSDAPTFRCRTHGKKIPAVVCGHLVGTPDGVRGFVENSSEPTDLQGWCEDCERMFEREGEMTPAFRKFTDMQVVCNVCYVRIRERHTRTE